MKNAISTLYLFILGLNKCKFVPTRIGKKYNFVRAQFLKNGSIPTKNQSTIEEPSIFVQPCCVLVVVNETCTMIEFEVKTNNCKHLTVISNFAKNGQHVWYEKDLFDILDKKEKKCSEN